jgi:hypothetical protein
MALSCACASIDLRKGCFVEKSYKFEELEGFDLVVEVMMMELR